MVPTVGGWPSESLSFFGLRAGGLTCVRGPGGRPRRKPVWVIGTSNGSVSAAPTELAGAEIGRKQGTIGIPAVT